MMGEMVVVRSRDAWARQAREAFNALLAAAPNEGAGLQLRDLNAVDHTQFCRLIEALYALGQSVSQELLDLAEMAPVADVLEG